MNTKSGITEKPLCHCVTSPLNKGSNSRAMKDSGIAWIGQIPEDWRKSKIKFVATIHNGDRGINYPSGDDMTDEGVYFITSNNIVGIKLDCNKNISKFITEERYNLLSGAKIKFNDIIYCLRGSIGKCAINKDILKGTVASSLTCLRVNKAYPDFINYSLQSNIILDQVKIFMNGTCAANLAAENVANFFFLEPPLPEQQAIADYLDKKCAAIDNVLEKTKASIEEYKKLKQSVITQAVTKGIQPNRPMKDSGIEWIGQIPEEWNVSQIKYYLKRKSVKGQPDAMVLSLYRDYGIVPKDSRDDNHNVTSLDTGEYKVVSKGDFVINKMKAWQGSMAVSDYDGIVSPAYHVCEFINNKIFRKYFHYLMRNVSYIPEYLRLSTGLRVGQWDLSYDDFKNIPFLIPPYAEQTHIADFLDKKCSEIDNIISKKEQLIKEVETYKKSLIYEYVTGKKEVIE